MIRRFGLMGFPLKHSFSRTYFKKKFEEENIHNAIYQNFPVIEAAEILALVDVYPFLEGVNITIPYKEAVIPFLDHISKDAQAIGAVNCVCISPGSRQLIGFNTDVDGFVYSLQPLLQAHHTAALVLGSGGSSKAVQYGLQHLGIDHKIVSRTPADGQWHYSDITADVLRSYPLIVNTTPLGMYPNIEGFPLLPYEEMSDKNLLFDLVYNPEETMFLQQGMEKGAKTKNGMEMLKIQAERSWEIWNQQT